MFVCTLSQRPSEISNRSVRSKTADCARGARVRLVLLVVAGALVSQAAGAAEPEANKPQEPVSGTENGSVVTYDRAYLAAFNAISAEDLLRRIPGIQDLLGGGGGGGSGGGGDQRGFGSSGSSILFNGRRLSGKSNTPVDALRRIQARQVVRVEVIRGSAPGLDVRVGNEGMVVNVVLESALSSGYGSWEASARYFTDGTWQAGGKLSYAGEIGALGYTLGVEIDPRLRARTADDQYSLPPNPAPFGRASLLSEDRATKYIGTAGLKYDFTNGDVANLNGRYASELLHTVQPQQKYRITSPTSEVYTGSTLLLKDADRNADGEIGGDFEHGFSSGDSLRALFILSSKKRPADANYFATPPGGSESETLRQVIKADSSERILRSYYKLAIAPGHSLEVGGEVAFNALNQTNQRFENIGVGGALVPVALFNSNSKVKETRFESFTRYSWQAAPSLYVEGAVDTEYSSLKQRGVDLNASRSLFFIKPRLDMRYDVSPRVQLRGRIFRTVSQLDFANFVTSVSTNDVRVGVIQAGNPNLVPEKTLTFETTGEYSLPSDQGTVSLRVFYNDITDAIDKLVIGPDVAGTGNIGAAKSYGAEAKAGLRLGWLNLPGASIEATGKVKDSSVRDSFTLVRRPLNEFRNYDWSVTFRHDINWHNLAYGATFEGEDATFSSDIDFTQSYSAHPEASAFVEMRAAGLVFRLQVRELMWAKTRDRLAYVGNRATSALEQREMRHESIANEYRFIVRGTF